MKKDEAIEKLKRQQSLIEELKGENHESPKFHKWIRDTEVAIKKIFLDKHDGRLRFINIRYHREPSWSEARHGVSHPHQYQKGLEEAKSLLQSLIEEIEEYGEDEPSVQEENGKKVEVSGTDVFIVHGHDHRAKAELETFLKEIGLTPIVLHRKPDEGQTLIEKFERHSDVGYAFILLTPDETAYLTSEEAKPDADRIKEKRARPNVIFEFGYFIGKLGRSRVCCLHTGNVSIPSDLGGLLYKPFQVSIDEVAYSIIKELKAIGYKLKVD